MAITSAELVKSLTGATSDGGVQASADASLGNYRSSTTITTGADNNLFDDISGAEASAGCTEYRCLVFQNTNALLDLTTAKVYVSAEVANTDVTYALCLERPTTLTTGNAQSIANETTAPDLTNVTYNTSGAWTDSASCNSFATGLAVGPLNSVGTADLKTSELIFVWIRRVISASASAASSQGLTVTIQGDTAA